MNKIISFLISNGLFAVFVVILLEYSCFPISSEIVLPFAGALAQHKKTPYMLLLLISIPAGVIGTTICYMFGYFGGHRLINKLSRKFPSIASGINYSYSFFDRHGKVAVCVGRLIPLCRTYISFIAGATRQPLTDYLIFSFIGITIWNSILIGFGYVLGSNWENVIGLYSAYKKFLIPLLCFTVLALFLKNHRKHRIQN